MNRIVLLIAVLVTVLLSGGLSFAYYLDTDFITVRQPNGVTFVGREWGDEFEFNSETEDGYKYKRDVVDGYFYYAELDSRGEFHKSGFKVEIDDPVENGIEKHLKRSSQRKKEIEAEKRRRGFLPTIGAAKVSKTLGAPPEVTQGIVLVEFTDVKHRTSPSAYTKVQFEDMLFSTNYTSHPDGETVFGSVWAYYDDMSGGTFNLTKNNGGGVLNSVDGNGVPIWLTLPESKAIYDSLTASIFFNAAIQAAQDAGINTSTSTTRKIAYIYAGNLYDAGGLTPQVNGIGGGYYSMSERRDSNHDTNVRKQEYAGANFPHIGTHAHEFGHLLGQYHPGTDMGWWSLMQSGSQSGSRIGNCPFSLSPEERMNQGWLQFTAIAGREENKQIGSGVYYRLFTGYQSEYYVLEHRKGGQGFNRYLWKHFWSGSGLLVWYIRQSNFGLNQDLIEADGIANKDNLFGDPFPGSSNNQNISDFTTPSIKSGSDRPSSWPNTHVAAFNITNNTSSTTADVMNNYWAENIATSTTLTYGAYIGGTMSISGSGTIVTSNADITVSTGKMLTIGSATTLKFTTTDGNQKGLDPNRCELVIEGKLLADGTSGSITFQSTNGGTTKEEWYGIIFKSSADNTSTVKNCNIKNAKYGVYVDTSAPKIDDNTITYSTVGVKTVGMGSTGRISGNTLELNTTGLSLNSSSVPNVHDNTSINNNDNIGVYMDSSSPSSFYNNTMDGNDGEGVYLFNNASPTFGNNKITGNGLWGLHLWNNSDPILEGTGTTGRKNKIVDNGGSTKAEIYCQKDSNPKLGLSSNPGDNNIYDDAGGKAIFIDTGYSYASINAEFNWWGTDPPDPAVLFSPSSEVDYVPYETELIPKPVALAREVSLQEERLIQALLAEENRQYDVAVGLYDQLLLESFEVEMVERAADGLFRAALHRGTDLSSVISRFDALASSHPAASVRRKVVALWRQALVADGQYNAAIAAYEQEMTESEDFDDRLSAQKSLGEVYMYYMKDETQARQLLEPILRDYPNHPVAYGAWMVLLDVEDLPPPPAGREASQPVASASTASEPSSDIGLKTSPNPFNPTTTIRFQLPETARVQLSIYNLLGQRVQELMPEELQPAGEYAVVWNGQDESGQPVGSGMYIVQLKINERTYTLETNERTYTRLYNSYR